MILDRKADERTVTHSASVRPEPHGWDHSRWDELIFDAPSAISVEIKGELRTVAALASQAMKFLEDSFKVIVCTSGGE